MDLLAMALMQNGHWSLVMNEHRLKCKTDIGRSTNCRKQFECSFFFLGETEDRESMIYKLSMEFSSECTEAGIERACMHECELSASMRVQ